MASTVQLVEPTLFEWLFTDRTTGEIVIAQYPNPPLWLFYGFTAAGAATYLVKPVSLPLVLAGAGSLAWWGALEITQGVNPARRLFGVGAIATAAGIATTRVLF